MHTFKTTAITAIALTLAAQNAFASVGPTAPGPGIFALLALGVVGAIGISRLRK